MTAVTGAEMTNLTLYTEENQENVWWLGIM